MESMEQWNNGNNGTMKWNNGTIEQWNNGSLMLENSTHLPTKP
jgi:hypothetical protein